MAVGQQDLSSVKRLLQTGVISEDNRITALARIWLALGFVGHAYYAWGNDFSAEDGMQISGMAVQEWEPIAELLGGRALPPRNTEVNFRLDVDSGGRSATRYSGHFGRPNLARRVWQVAGSLLGGIGRLIGRIPVPFRR